MRSGSEVRAPYLSLLPMGIFLVVLLVLPMAIATPRMGINYQTKYHEFGTPDEVLDRDFTLLKDTGITDISISLYWYRLEGDTRGDYDGGTVSRGLWGDRFLENVKRVIRKAYGHGIRTMVTIHTLWGSDSEWCTPDYAIDPLSGRSRGLSIVRSQYARDGFIQAVKHAVEALKDEEGISSWAILNEPWYWPHDLPEPYDHIDQFENFVSLIETLSTIVKKMDERPVVIRFINVKIHGGPEQYSIKDIFADDFKYDLRVLQAVDIVGFNVYRPIEGTRAADQVLDTWSLMTMDHFKRMDSIGKRYMITEMGYSVDDDSNQNSAYSEYWEDIGTSNVEVVYSWQWSSEGATDTAGLPGEGFNLCSDAEGNPRPAFWTFSSWGRGSEWITINLEKGLNLIGWLGSDQNFSQAFNTVPGVTKVWRRNDDGAFSSASYQEEGVWWSPDGSFQGLDYGGAYFLECISSCTLITEASSGPEDRSWFNGNLLVWRGERRSLDEGLSNDPQYEGIRKIWHRNDLGGYSFSEYYPSVELWWSPDPEFTHMEKGEAYFIETNENSTFSQDVMSWHLESWNWEDYESGKGEKITGDDGAEEKLDANSSTQDGIPEKVDFPANLLEPEKVYFALRALYRSPFIQCLRVMTKLDDGFGLVLNYSPFIGQWEYYEAMEQMHSSFLN